LGITVVSTMSRLKLDFLIEAGRTGRLNGDG
jgi:hypothetical protein